MRGNRVPKQRTIEKPGSIPACAGDLGDARDERNGVGSIPACAGEPAHRGTGLCPRRVYPRVCGGTSDCGVGVSRNWGLSPRVRGNRRRYVVAGLLVGSIPACAGEPTSSHMRLSKNRVYPRVCGGTDLNRRTGMIQLGLSPRVRGNNASPPRRLSWRGLSPRVRGNQRKVKVAHQTGGSIPACAGEPLTLNVWPASGTVYPRVCGGTRPALQSVGPLAGLSPRVRGNQARAAKRRASGRSIPACAGEPRLVHQRIAPSGVYPRVCGGTASLTRGPIPFGGLSPRVRGNHGYGGQPSLSGRSIPACAGEPRLRRSTKPIRKVYPRVCGGTPCGPCPPLI